MGNETKQSQYTLPDNLNISLRQFPNEASANEFGYTCLYLLKELSQQFDLSHLDGVTIAYDYAYEVAALDRGVDGFKKLAPSSGDVEGIAMAPAVMREGQLKSHLLLNANYLVPMLDGNEEELRLGLNVIAHECAHVESNHAFYNAFPDYSYGKVLNSVTEYLRTLAGQASWDEYFATKFSANIGDSNPKAFQDTFLRTLASSERLIHQALVDYQSHHDVAKGIEDVGNRVIDLMKFAAYMIGDVLGRQEIPANIPNVNAALIDSWFKPYFDELVEALSALDIEYPQWRSFDPFERVLTLYDKILEHFGVVVENSDSQNPYVHFLKMPFYDYYLS